MPKIKTDKYVEKVDDPIHNNYNNNNIFIEQTDSYK
jgi:hypothetical protein